MERVKKHEGFRGVPYEDAGGWSVGYGRNLTFNPLTPDEGEYLLQNDLHKVLIELQKELLFWNKLDGVRQEVLVEMAYNLGVAGLLRFKKMLTALDNGEWLEASYQCLHSRWAGQVGARADALACMLLTGEYL